MELTKLRQHTVPALSGSPTESGRFTLNYSVGPHTLVAPNRLVTRGHPQHWDLAELQLPATSGPATVVRWFDPTNGAIKAYDKAYREGVKDAAGNWVNDAAGNPQIAHPGSQKMTHRGLSFMDGLLWGVINLFYSVSNDQTIKSFWTSNGTTFRGFARTNKHPLRAAGRIGPLSKQLREAFGCDTFCSETSPQGTTYTNNGPGLYVYNRQPNLTDGQVFSVQKIFEHPAGAGEYPDWDSDREIHGMASLPTCMAYLYRKSVGARWYGGHDVQGRAIKTPSNELVMSLLTPGAYAKDTCDSVNKGYHAEAFVPVLLTASNESIIAGHPIWEETDLRPYGLNSKCARVSLSYDAESGLMTMVESGAVGVLPLVHVFKVKTESEMQAQIDALQAAYDALVAQHAAELAVKDQQISSVTAQRDALQAKVTNALAALN